MKYLLIITFALLCPWFTDLLVDWQFADQGYTVSDRREMDALVQSALAEPRPARGWTATQRSEALDYLWGH